ncbi:hypothetical protein SAMN05880545_2044 [Microbacterium sp. RU33B]|nr:hypothetical protein SAMN05880545_2044 [Microbacterium sp. RU33B]
MVDRDVRGEAVDNGEVTAYVPPLPPARVAHPARGDNPRACAAEAGEADMAGVSALPREER